MIAVVRVQTFAVMVAALTALALAPTATSHNTRWGVSRAGAERDLLLDYDTDVYETHCVGIRSRSFIHRGSSGYIRYYKHLKCVVYFFDDSYAEGIYHVTGPANDDWEFLDS